MGVTASMKYERPSMKLAGEPCSCTGSCRRHHLIFTKASKSCNCLFECSCYVNETVQKKPTLEST